MFTFKSIVAVAFAALAVGAAPATTARAEMHAAHGGVVVEGGGVVTIVDDASRTFGCHWKTHDWTYKTTDRTVFRLGKRQAAFSDLKTGQIVRVAYHVVDESRVADKVVIASP